MFCYQCEQTRQGTACTAKGVCAKTPEVAALQDLLLYAARGLAHAARRAANPGDAAALVGEALFTTVTNVNFDADSLARRTREIAARRDALGVPAGAPDAATFVPADTLAALVEQGEAIGIAARRTRFGEDRVGLQELLTYGLKGVAAYAHHARILGQADADVDAFLLEALDALNDPAPTVDGLFALAMRCGEISVKVLALLDAANTGRFGNPEPTQVRMGPVKGKAILVSGHDLADLAALLEQTAGTGIHVYTHGEMLPAHGYPELKKYPHLVGHYGGAWMLQKEEFAAFPGAIVMTTNCLMEPRPQYRDRLFTRGLVAFPGIRHLETPDFAPAIAAALEAPGFAEDAPAPRTHWVGFGHAAVLGVADTVIGAVKSGEIKRFMLVGGCDGAEGARGYFTEIADKAPKDWVILTLGCGKFRLTDLDLGSVAGLPRLLDMGQCNDSYSAVRVALALAEAFGTDVNGLPLSLVISWYEQKAVCVLLALLFLGVKGIRLGPRLPAFVSPAMLKVLVERFDIKATAATAEDDLAAIMAAGA
ncbi:Hydroxylamine reductase [uncultured Alphaproteobacteria bacterium]|uniref:Hydroxylamine reductase n=1 Tax=uncultured Alphaproteobacteria bacterium TaxID=91750 RepID=A0A212JBC0_9PROT|nr:Hydroxylamine reductase [uncultured Alphaproteobacteria bacterium]